MKRPTSKQQPARRATPAASALRAALAVAMAAALLAAAGCDTSITAFAEDDRHFALYGYLDASRSIQHLRVEALRDGGLRAGDSLAVRATLTDVDRDTEIRMQRTPSEQNEGVAIFSTSAVSVRPGATYRVLVERPADGATSRAQTTVPTDQFSIPSALTINVDLSRCNDPMYVPAPLAFAVTGTDRIVAANAIYFSGDDTPLLTGSHLRDTTRANGRVQVQMFWNTDVGKCAPGVERFEVEIATGSADWPDYLGLGVEQSARPGTSTNVEGGVGFFGGAVSRRAEVTIRRQESSP